MPLLHSHFSMRLRFLLVLLPVVLVACGVDTTGISPASTSEPRGAPSAAVTVTVFGDLQCPACQSSHALVTTPLLAQYGDKIRFEWKHFPLRSIHPYAFKAAQATECAADQGKFWDYLDLAYEHQEDLRDAPYKAWAQQLNLDEDLFGRCLVSGIKGDAVLADYADGEAMNVRGTPTYFVNGEPVESSLAAISAAIETSLQQLRTVKL